MSSHRSPSGQPPPARIKLDHGASEDLRAPRRLQRTTVLPSAHCGEHWPSGNMIVLEAEQGPLPTEVSRRECGPAGDSD
jgi:hypothetical protein